MVEMEKSNAFVPNTQHVVALMMTTKWKKKNLCVTRVAMVHVGMFVDLLGHPSLQHNQDIIRIVNYTVSVINHQLDFSTLETLFS